MNNEQQNEAMNREGGKILPDRIRDDAATRPPRPRTFSEAAPLTPPYYVAEDRESGTFDVYQRTDGPHGLIHTSYHFSCILGLAAMTRDEAKKHAENQCAVLNSLHRKNRHKNT